MISTFKTHLTTAINRDTLWNTLINPNFVRDLLPEIQRNIMGLKLYTLSQHKNGLNVMPAYLIRFKTIHWYNDFNTTLELANSDLNIDINHIEINLEVKKESTKVSIEVEYEHPLDLNFIRANKAIKSLFKQKLTVLKKDLETAEQAEVTKEPSFGYPVF